MARPFDMQHRPGLFTVRVGLLKATWVVALAARRRWLTYLRLGLEYAIAICGPLTVTWNMQVMTWTTTVRRE